MKLDKTDLTVNVSHESQDGMITDTEKSVQYFKPGWETLYPAVEVLLLKSNH